MFTYCIYQLCDIWAEDQRAYQSNCLSESQMHNLATAMREYIHTQDSTNLDNYLKELLSVVQYGNMTLEELQRSIYSLNEAVSAYACVIPRSFNCRTNVLFEEIYLIQVMTSFFYTRLLLSCVQAESTCKVRSLF